MKNTTITMREVTVWEGNTPNHTYVFAEKPGARTGVILGHIPHGTQDLQFYKNPITIETRGRLFTKV